MNTIKTLLLLFLSAACLRAAEPEKFTSVELVGKVYNVAGSHALKFAQGTVHMQPEQRDIAPKTYGWKLVQGVLVLSSTDPAEAITYTLIERRGPMLVTQFKRVKPGVEEVEQIERWQLATTSGKGRLK